MDIVAVGTAVVRVDLAMMSSVGAAVVAAAAGQYYYSRFDIAKRHVVVEDGYYSALYVSNQLHVLLGALHIGCIYSMLSSSLWLVVLCYKLGIAKFCDGCPVFCYTEDNNRTWHHLVAYSLN